MERALSEAEERDEAFEVVISDYYMPRFRAPDALALLRNSTTPTATPTSPNATARWPGCTAMSAWRS
jgi:hypothetical protein